VQSASFCVEYGALRAVLKQSGVLKLSDEINSFSSPAMLFNAHGSPRTAIQIQSGSKIKHKFYLPKSLTWYSSIYSGWHEMPQKAGSYERVGTRTPLLCRSACVLRER
jgi:hypothetical protein